MVLQGKPVCWRSAPDRTLALSMRRSRLYRSLTANFLLHKVASYRYITLRNLKQQFVNFSTYIFFIALSLALFYTHQQNAINHTTRSYPYRIKRVTAKILMMSIPTVCSCLSSATCWLSGALVTHVAAINSFRLGYISPLGTITIGLPTAVRSPA